MMSTAIVQCEFGWWWRRWSSFLLYGSLWSRLLHLYDGCKCRALFCNGIQKNRRAKNCLRYFVGHLCGFQCCRRACFLQVTVYVCTKMQIMQIVFVVDEYVYVVTNTTKYGTSSGIQIYYASRCFKIHERPCFFLFFKIISWLSSFFVLVIFFWRYTLISHYCTMILYLFQDACLQ